MSRPPASTPPSSPASWICWRAQAETGITTLLISHDISVIQRLSDRIAVMYGGTVVETGRAGRCSRRKRRRATRTPPRCLPRSRARKRYAGKAICRRSKARCSIPSKCRAVAASTVAATASPMQSAKTARGSSRHSPRSLPAQGALLAVPRCGESMSRTILEVTDLRKDYSQRRGLMSMLTGQGRVIPAVGAFAADGRRPRGRRLVWIRLTRPPPGSRAPGRSASTSGRDAGCSPCARSVTSRMVRLMPFPAAGYSQQRTLCPGAISASGGSIPAQFSRIASVTRLQRP